VVHGVLKSNRKKIEKLKVVEKFQSLKMFNVAKNVNEKKFHLTAYKLTALSMVINLKVIFVGI